MNKYNLDKENQITDKKLFDNRRKIMKSMISLPFIFSSNLFASPVQQKLKFNKVFFTSFIAFTIISSDVAYENLM